jgi:Ser-tRNA(Ala) deacylase AlaX
MSAFETERVYLEDTNIYECSATILSVDEKGLILSKTVFSPQGGGQPSDKGTIAASGKFWAIDLVKVVDGGNILHFVEDFGENPPCVGMNVIVKIDKELRATHSRLHSAGHALDKAMTNIGYPPERLKATKGYHFLDGPHVEYEITGEALTPEEIAGIPLKLNSEMKALVAANVETVVVQEMSKAEALAKTGGREEDMKGYPETLRMVSVAGMFIPCSGTHVKSSGEIGEVEITRAKRKKNTLKISYVLSG